MDVINKCYVKPNSNKQQLTKTTKPNNQILKHHSKRNQEIEKERGQWKPFSILFGAIACHLWCNTHNLLLPAMNGASV